MIPALARPAIRYPGEQFQQVTAGIRMGTDTIGAAGADTAA
jgi:hypothetical protein